MSRGKLVILSGPSGVGKGAVNKELAKDKTLKLEYSVSMTTRNPRPGEVDGVNYFFVDKETFQNAIEHNELVEYAEFIGNLYGTPKSYIDKETQKGNNVILEIEVIGATQILKKYNPENLISIFLMPPSLTNLEARLRTRGTEDENIIKQRLDKALLEIPLKHKYAYVIENDGVENAVAKIKDVLLKEGTLDRDKNESYFFKLQAKIDDIVKEKYSFFVKNWTTNISPIEIKKVEDGYENIQNYLVSILTNKIYKHVLANEDITVLNDDEFVSTICEHFMLDIDFFSYEQSQF